MQFKNWIITENTKIEKHTGDKMANNTFKEWCLKKEFANLENKICQTLYEHMNTEEKKDCDRFKLKRYNQLKRLMAL